MTFLTLSEYLLGAKKIMAAQKCGFLIKDEDAVSYVAYRMMIADKTWNGTSTRETWRYNQAKYALMRLLDKRKKRNKHQILSLDYGWNNKEHGDDRVLLMDKISESNHEDIYEKFEIICEYAKKCLNDKQFQCLIRYYRDHKTMQIIADELGISKQRVGQCLQSVKGTLKKCLSKQDL